jgi:hypothetical protein
MAEFNIITIASRKNDPPSNPFVYVILSGLILKDPDGHIKLSRDLFTEVDIEEYVKSLIRQLQKAGEKAKRELQKAKEQNRSFSR